MNKLTIGDCELADKNQQLQGYSNPVYKQLADTMRENERLQERIKELNWEVEKQLSRQSMTISSYAADQPYKPTGEWGASVYGSDAYKQGQKEENIRLTEQIVDLSSKPKLTGENILHKDGIIEHWCNSPECAACNQSKPTEDEIQETFVDFERALEKSSMDVKPFTDNLSSKT